MNNAKLEMSVYDNLGPLTRHVLSEAPESLDALKLVQELKASAPVLRRIDAQVAKELTDMISREHGDPSRWNVVRIK